MCTPWIRSPGRQRRARVDSQAPGSNRSCSPTSARFRGRFARPSQVRLIPGARTAFLVTPPGLRLPAVAMLPAMLEHDRKQAGWSVGQAAWQLGVTVREYGELEAGTSITELRDVGPDLQAVRLVADVPVGQSRFFGEGRPRSATDTPRRASSRLPDEPRQSATRYRGGCGPWWGWFHRCKPRYHRGIRRRCVRVSRIGSVEDRPRRHRRGNRRPCPRRRSHRRDG